MTTPTRYHTVSQDACEKNEADFPSPRDPVWLRSAVRRPSSVFGAIFIVSLIANGLLLYQRIFHPWRLYNDLPTQYAGLRRTIPSKIVPPEDFASTNRTIQDAAWSDPRLDTWKLFVALDDGYIVSQDLPSAQRWPWDDEKGVYIPYAAHQLHCVNVLRSFVNDKEDGVPEAELDWSYAHSIHCLNILRDVIMCNADDLPLYTGYRHENAHVEDPAAGRGQVKMCRDWDALIEWTNERSACYDSINRKNPEFPELERYKFCPDGSRPWEDVKQPSA